MKCQKCNIKDVPNLVFWDENEPNVWVDGVNYCYCSNCRADLLKSMVPPIKSYTLPEWEQKKKEWSSSKP